MSTAVSVETLKGQESELPTPAMFQTAKEHSNAPSSPFSETSSPIPIAPDAPAQSGAPSSLLSPRQALKPVDECMGGLSGIDPDDGQASVMTAGGSSQLYLVHFVPSTMAPKRLWAFMAHSMRVRSTSEGPAKRMFKLLKISEWHSCKASSAASHAPDVA